MDPDDREFVRELLLRHERATDAHVTALERLQGEIEANTRRIDANTQILLDVHGESLAQRDGMLRLIDRIDRMGAGGQG